MPFTLDYNSSKFILLREPWGRMVDLCILSQLPLSFEMAFSLPTALYGDHYSYAVTINSSYVHIPRTDIPKYQLNFQRPIFGAAFSYRHDLNIQPGR